jgi:GNAT superfamily N-acetyltransferase
MEDQNPISESYEVLRLQWAEMPESYRAFVVTKWLNSNREGNKYFKLIDESAYFGRYKAFLNELLALPGLAIRIARLSSEPDVLLGFSVMREEQGILHYVFVHRHHQSQGIARALVPVIPKAFTHLTDQAFSLWNLKAPKAIFNPFFI